MKSNDADKITVFLWILNVVFRKSILKMFYVVDHLLSYQALVPARRILFLGIIDHLLSVQCTVVVVMLS